jgi:hypothetical protein
VRSPLQAEPFDLPTVGPPLISPTGHQGTFSEALIEAIND